MHAIKGGWVGQAFALATSNDSGRKKSRIRRSKEERKDMVESYIKKYQKSNNGNFPSLNLTHKEVGGSFYTVREIVREIIQENRVLAPPKVLVDDYDYSVFIEQHPLGSLSIEPKTDSSVFANAVNGSEPCEKNQEFDSVVIDAVPVHHQAYSEESTLPSGHKIGGPGSQRHGSEQYVNSDDEGVNGEKFKEFRQRTYTESVVMSIPDGQKERDKVETYQVITSHKRSNVVVETFPLRPIFPTIHDMDVETWQDKEIQQEKLQSMESSNSLVIENDMKKNQDLELEQNHVYGEEKVELNLQIPSLEGPNSSEVGTGGLNVVEVKNVESKGSMPDGTKDVDSTESFITKDSTSIKRKSGDCENTSLQTASDLILDRIDSETQEDESERPVRPENYDVLAFIKTFISAFLRFWTE
ncbi:uncharacterized protein [Primulina eburnea]|uniref:uncharacterized protein isoform X1 n=1 Tax=Primulina eburnea TaxID=1245227 RepID=UPI003C6C0003